MKKDMTNAVKITIRIPQDLALQYKQLKILKGRNKPLNDFYLTALEMFLSPDEADKKEAVLARRLDRLDRQLKSLLKGQEVLAETLALYIRGYLTTSIELPQDQKPAALAQAGRRWKKFLEILSERVGGGQILFTDLPEKVFKPENFEEHKTEVKSNASSAQS
jgi:hypothetical protein